MEIHPQLLIFAISLIAIFALAALAKVMRLGGDARIADEDEARRLADEVSDGFVAEQVALDPSGCAALLKDAEGRIMLIKRHGNQFAGRILTKDAKAEVATGTIYIDSGERQFGGAHIEHDEASVSLSIWADAINRLGRPEDA
ncbi:MAG: hypothetical protein AAF250_14415 [Pseudomonadota bacterium]